MLNKLKSWKDSLIDKVTNVSLKNIKVSKTSFRVHTFVLSMVLVCTISTIMIMNKTLFSNAAGLDIPTPVPLTNVAPGGNISFTLDAATETLTVTGYGTLTGSAGDMIWNDGSGSGWDSYGGTDVKLIKEFKYLRIIGQDTTNMIKFPSNLTYIFDDWNGGHTYEIYLENVDLSAVTSINGICYYCRSLKSFTTKNCICNSNKLSQAHFFDVTSGHMDYLDLSCFDFKDLAPGDFSINPSDYTMLVDKIILPKNMPNMIFDMPCKIYEGCCGYDSSDNLVQRDIKKGEAIDSRVAYLKPGPKTLYVDPLTNIEYYSDGTTSDTSTDSVSILTGDFYISNGSAPDTNVNAIWDISSAKNNSLRAYIFNDGLMIFDGAGECFDFTNYHNLKYTNGGNALYTENNAPINKVKNIVASNDGFAPTGKIISLFASVGNKSQLETVDLTRMNFSGVTHMTSLFENDINLTNIIGLDSIDTSSCTHFDRMFLNCKSLTSINITNFNTDLAIEIKNMFNGCNSLTSINVSNLNTKKVKDFGGLFAQCSSLEHINISNFKGQPTNVNGMFQGLTSLKTPIVFPSDFSKFTGDDINDITSFDVSKINKFSAFYQDSTTPYVTYWDLSMFSHCDNPITSAEFSCYQLYGTINLSGVDLSGLTQTSSRTYVFGKDNQTEIILPKKVPSENHYIAREAKDGDDNWFKYIWHGYDINGDPIDYYVIDTKLPAADPGDDGVFQAGELYKIKKEIAIYYIENEGTDDEIVYRFDGAYNKAGTKIYNCASYTNNLTRESEAPSYSYRSICAFLYGDGTFILHGKGDLKEVGNGYNDKGEIPWRKDGNIKKIKRVLGSRYGFIPYGSMQSYFDMNTTTANDNSYYPIDDSVDSNNQHLELVDFTNIDTSNVTDFSLMFNGCGKLETIIGFENIKTNNAENFYRTFCGCSKLKFTNDTLDISNWNISNARDFTEAFCGVNVTNVKMDGVTFNSNGVSLSRMFATIGGPKNISIKNTISSEYINSVHDIFSTNYRGAKVDLTGMKLNGLTNAENWGNPNNISEIILPDECDSDVTIAPIGDTTFFAYDINGNKLGNKAYGKLIAAEGNTLGKIYKLVRENCVLYKDNDANVSYYRTGTSKNSGTDLITLATYDDDNDLGTPEIDCVWDISESKNKSMYAYLYTDGTMIFDGKGTNEYYYNADNRPWDSIKDKVKRVYASNGGFQPTRLNHYFGGCSNLETFDDTRFDLTNVTSLYRMFKGCSKITSIKLTTKPQNLSSDYGLFDECTNLQTLDLSGFNGYKLNSQSNQLFNGCIKLSNIIGLSDIDFSSVNNAFGMFSNCNKLDSIEINSLTSVASLKQMFNYNSNLTTLKLNNLNTTGVTDTLNFNSMFSGCDKLSSLDLKNANISNMPSNIINNITSLREVILPSDVPALADAIVLPAVTDYVWFGYAIDGTTKVGGQFTTLPKAGEVPDLYMIKLEPYTIKKLDINNLTLSDSEKAGAIINKDGTDRVLDTISFNDANSNTLHPYILDSDGITPIYLSYEKAYVSDSAGDPKFIARAKDTSDPLAISNITFEGLKLVDTSGAYELYTNRLFDELLSPNNKLILNNSSYLIDNTSPSIDKIIINNSKSNKLKENDTVNVSITFSEELDFNLLDTDSFVNTYKDNIYLSYKIGSNTFDNYKLNLSSIESPRALSDTNRKTIMKFTGMIPNDLGELIDAPFTLYDIKLDGITSDEVRDASINALDVSNFSIKVNVPELTGYLVNTKVDEPDPIKPEPEKSITTQTITVQVVKNNSYIDGYSDGTFKPNENITRGEFSKMLAYISNNYSDSNKLDYSRYINSFKDINASDWYSSYVGFNNKKQVMVGYSDGTFKPNKTITRAEAAKALTNMFSINNNNNVDTASTFNNELNGKWYEYSMKKLINAGLLKGYPDGLLRPNDPITRAEMVALINRITNRDINNNAINNNSNLRNIPYDVDSNKWYYKDIISALNDY